MFIILGVTIKILKETLWAVLIVTPIMKRMHLMTCSSELIFIDSTSSCEATQSTLTVMLAVTKAGAIPVAVFVHEAQSSASYKRAFLLFKENFPKAFGMNSVSICVNIDNIDNIVLIQL